ncbi:MAG: hypothetical protein NTX87_15530 [Planctomycetota bacterium]|nr:hypothetical protein [Planctomycetota bacterium]
MKCVLSLLAAVLLASPGVIAAEQAAARQRTWEKVEIVLTAARDYRCWVQCPRDDAPTEFR